MEFKKFTGNSIKKEKIRISEKPYGAGGKHARISSFKFSGDCSQSPNGEFWVAWSDAYVLKKNPCYFGHCDQILLSGEGQSPEYGKVANNGNFIINDGPRNRIGNTFYAIDKNGNTLIQRSFEVNVHMNGISDDGNFAFCDCMGVLYFFDLDSRSLLWQIIPECGRGEYTTYLFDTEKRHLHICIKSRNERIYRYDFEGNFIDKEKWEEEKITYGTMGELYYIAKERLTTACSPVSQDKSDEVLSLLNRALSKNEMYQNERYKALIYKLMGEVYETQNDTDRAIENYEWALQFEQKPQEKAKTYRLLGEAYESQFNIDQAIENYESALQLDLKVGVKKKLNKLEQLRADDESRSI